MFNDLLTKANNRKTIMFCMLVAWEFYFYFPTEKHKFPPQKKNGRHYLKTTTTTNDFFTLEKRKWTTDVSLPSASRGDQCPDGEQGRGEEELDAYCSRILPSVHLSHTDPNSLGNQETTHSHNQLRYSPNARAARRGHPRHVLQLELFYFGK